MSIEQAAFLAMVFVAVAFLASSIMIPTFGTEARTARRLRGRVREVVGAAGTDASVLRENYLRRLTPFERRLEQLPGMEVLSLWLEQAGRSDPGYKVVLTMAWYGLAAGVAAMLFTRSWLIAVGIALVGFFVPLVRLQIQRSTRLNRFEEQLPDALNSISRALRAGHPFTAAVRLVAEEMSDPVAGEFERVFNDLNYGSESRLVFSAMLQRVPSISLMAAVTAILIQKDTGGNLAEILDKIATVVRGRFRFQRRVRTLSAEGRMSAWILTMVPFVLAIVVSLISPDYLPMLVKDPMGHMLIGIAFVGMLIGMIWMRQIIRIEV
jgi:tight adherence protein B